MDRNLLKPLIAVVAATASLAVWGYASASQSAKPPIAQVAQIDGGNMPADHASHHIANTASANVFTGTLPHMGATDMSAMMGSTSAGAMMGSPDMSAMGNSASAGAMMKSGDMSAMMKSGDMKAMMDSADMGATMSAADKRACLDADGDMAKMQAHMTQMSKMPGHMQPGTESAK